MRLFLIFFVSGLVFISCETKKPDYQKLIQGNWECQYVDNENDTLSLNLYFSDSICHFFRDKDNINTFHVKNDQIEIETIERLAIDYPVRKHVLKIVQINKNRLKIIAISGALNDRLNIPITDTLTFVKIKKNNNLQIRCISFYSTGCNGCCPSFTSEMNSNNSIVYDGYSCSDFDGTYLGKSSREFWKLLKDKVDYVDFKNWKEKYNASWTCDQTCALVFETNKGIFKVSIYGNDKEPRALRNIVDYVLSNYHSFDLRQVKRSKIKFKHEEQIRKLGVLPLEETLQFIPPK